MTHAPTPPRPRSAWWAAVLAVPAAVVAYHWAAAAPGQALVGSDLRAYFFAMREATAAALRAGHLPGWQRGVFLGYPLLGDPQIGVFDPGTWLTLPWGAARALTLAALLHLCVGGWGMLLWLKRRGLGPLEATLGALLFALAAKQTVHLHHWNFAASMAWWPWMLAGLEGFAAAERGRGRDLCLTAGAAALSWFGGAAQMAYFGTLVAGAYAAVLAPALWRRRRVDAVLALAAAPLGLLLAAPMVLPVMELARYGPRGAGVGYRFATSWSWPDRWGWGLFVLPRAFGGDWSSAEMNAWEATGYLGILPLGLAAAAPLRRRGLWLFALLGLVGVWLCWGEGGWLGLHHALWRWLPGYGAFRNPTRSLMVTALASALLAAEGLGALRAGAEGLRRRALAAAALIAAALAAVVLPRLPGFALDEELARAGSVTTLALAAAGVAWLVGGRWLARARWGRVAWAAAPLALVLVDLHLAFGDFNRTGPAAAETAALVDLPPLAPAAPEPRRVAVHARWGQTANATLRLGLEGVTGYGPTVIQRVRSLLEATQTDALYPPSKVESDTDFPRVRPTSRLWPLLGAPLLVSDRSWRLPEVAPLRPEYDRATRLYRTPALPRAFWAGSWSQVPDAAVRDPILEAARGDRAVLGDEAPGAAFPPAGAPEGPVAATAVVAEGGRFEATLAAPRDGVAVVLEPWFPGWRATVDGAPATIARADFAFMAVPLARGTHTLRLEYHPTQLVPGFALGAATAALLLAALAWRRRSGRAGAQSGSPERQGSVDEAAREGATGSDQR